MDRDQQLEQLLREVRRLRSAVIALSVVAIAAGVIGATSAPSVVRAKGLVIVDDAGRERILLGAPTPVSATRTRRGAATSSLVFLGPDGADRVIVGESPQPQVQGHAVKRIAPAWGVVIHDPRGSERGGIAFLDSGRAVMALDYPTHDAIGMVVDDKTNSARLLLTYPTTAAPAAAAELVADPQSAHLTVNDIVGHNVVSLPANRR